MKQLVVDIKFASSMVHRRMPHEPHSHLVQGAEESQNLLWIQTIATEPLRLRDSAPLPTRYLQTPGAVQCEHPHIHPYLQQTKWKHLGEPHITNNLAWGVSSAMTSTTTFRRGPCGKSCAKVVRDLAWVDLDRRCQNVGMKRSWQRIMHHQLSSILMYLSLMNLVNFW